MKLKIKIAITAIFCLFLLSPSIFACHDCGEDATISIQTQLKLLIPLNIWVEPDANEDPPVLVQGTTIYPPFNYPPYASWHYGWTVTGAANYNVIIDLPNNNNDGKGVSFTGAWYLNRPGYPTMGDGYITNLVYDSKYDKGKVEFTLTISSVTAETWATPGLHSVNQEVSVMYHGI
jgi:hypothetical protein